jgi:hypothetical protein
VRTCHDSLIRAQRNGLNRQPWYPLKIINFRLMCKTLIMNLHYVGGDADDGDIVVIIVVDVGVIDDDDDDDAIATTEEDNWLQYSCFWQIVYTGLYNRDDIAVFQRFSCRCFCNIEMDLRAQHIPNIASRWDTEHSRVYSNRPDGKSASFDRR